MHTLIAAAAIAAGLAGHHDAHTRHGCYPGFAPDIHNGLLVTPPVEDQTRVYTPGYSAVRGRLWVGDDVKDIASRRAWRENPGDVAYGAVGAPGERVHVRVNNQRVSISPWQKVEGEGWSNFERGRQQWLHERGYTGGVRTFVHPDRVRNAQAAQDTHAEAERAGTPEPSATIRLREPRSKDGRFKQVRAGVAGGVIIVSGDEPVRFSMPMTVSAESVERAIARGWCALETTRTASSEK